MFGFIDREKANHSVSVMCRVLQVSRSGYYAWRDWKPSKRALEDARLCELIQEAHERSRGTYGSPRVHAELREAHGVRCSRKRVERLMRRLGLQGVHRRRARRPGGPRVLHPIFDDLVLREFTAEAPNQLCVADITQHWTFEGWLYLAVVLDAYSRPVVDWSMAELRTTHVSYSPPAASVPWAITRDRQWRSCSRCSPPGWQGDDTRPRYPS